MQIILKADLEMEDVLPPSATRNAQGDVVLSLNDESTLVDALAVTSLQPDEKYLVSVNEAMVLKANRSTHVLSDGDSIMILAPLRGG